MRAAGWWWCGDFSGEFEDDFLCSFFADAWSSGEGLYVVGVDGGDECVAVECGEDGECCFWSYSGYFLELGEEGFGVWGEESVEGEVFLADGECGVEACLLVESEVLEVGVGHEDGVSDVVYVEGDVVCGDVDDGSVELRDHGLFFSLGCFTCSGRAYRLLCCFCFF